MLLKYFYHINNNLKHYILMILGRFCEGLRKL